MANDYMACRFREQLVDLGNGWSIEGRGGLIDARAQQRCAPTDPFFHLNEFRCLGCSLPISRANDYSPLRIHCCL